MQTNAPSANTIAPNHGVLMVQKNMNMGRETQALWKQNRAVYCIPVSASEVCHIYFELTRKDLKRRDVSHIGHQLGIMNRSGWHRPSENKTEQYIAFQCLKYITLLWVVLKRFKASWCESNCIGNHSGTMNRSGWHEMSSKKKRGISTWLWQT